MTNVIRVAESIYCIVKKIFNKLENESVIFQDAFGNPVMQQTVILYDAFNNPI